MFSSKLVVFAWIFCVFSQEWVRSPGCASKVVVFLDIGGVFLKNWWFSANYVFVGIGGVFQW